MVKSRKTAARPMQLTSPSSLLFEKPRSFRTPLHHMARRLPSMTLRRSPPWSKPAGWISLFSSVAPQKAAVPPPLWPPLGHRVKMATHCSQCGVLFYYNGGLHCLMPCDVTAISRRYVCRYRLKIMPRIAGLFTTNTNRMIFLLALKTMRRQTQTETHRHT